MQKHHVVVGTSGHIDHGKTSLVRALTGRDTDTLREEQERKITIDLGFAFLGDHITVIDVPGHERFIKNMVTGAATLDFVLLVVAADDGVMPQTREHFDILRLLGLKHGMVALTKVDRVDADWLELVEDDLQTFVAGSFLEGAPICRVDSISGQGVEDLRTTLLEQIDQLPPTVGKGVFRLFVDRAFSVKGHGMVCTGTVLSGQLQVGDEIEVQPGHHKARVRQLQVHGESVEQVQSGDRAAINLQGLTKQDIRRGSVLAPLGLMQATTLLDVQLHLLSHASPLKHRDRVRVHMGTSEVMARVVLLGQSTLQPGQVSFAQLQLEEEVSALQQDSFVLRRYSPQETMGGGQVLDPKPLPHKPGSKGVVKRLQGMTLEAGSGRLMGLLDSPNKALWSLSDLQERTGGTRSELSTALKELIQSHACVLVEMGSRQLYIASSVKERLQTRLLDLLKAFHQAAPEQVGMPSAQLRSEVMPQRFWTPQELPLFDHLLKSLQDEARVRVDSKLLCLSDHVVCVPETLRGQMEELMRLLKSQAYKAPKPADLALELKISHAEVKRVQALCRNEGVIKQVTPEIQMPQDLYAQAIQRLRAAFAERAEGFSVSDAGELLDGASRRFTVPFLEHLDDEGITLREGNSRRFL
jgi:selenocysteine-specific elongation factor